MTTVITTGITGLSGVQPALAFMSTTDSLATVTGANYINNKNYNFQSNTILESVVAGNLFMRFKVLLGNSNNSATLYPMSSNLIAFDVTATFAQLAAAGTVVIVPPLTTLTQYKLRALQLNLVGTNFSGGSGNRLLQVTDGTNVFTVVPATNLQTLLNATWGATALPFPASVSIDTSTVAGSNLVISYSGGTTDYTAGSVTVSGILQQVA